MPPHFFFFSTFDQIAARPILGGPHRLGGPNQSVVGAAIIVIEAGPSGAIPMHSQRWQFPM